MLERLWRSKTVKPQRDENTPEKNQNQSPVNEDKHLPNSIGCRIIQIEMQMEEGSLSKDLMLQLLQQYTKAIQFYQEKGDERYRMFQKKIQIFLQKEVVKAVLKGQQDNGIRLIKKQRAMEQLRKAANNSKSQAKKLLQSSQKGAQNQKIQIQKQINRQMQSLQKRLQNKRSNSQLGKRKSILGTNEEKQKILSQLTDLPNIPKPKKPMIAKF